MHATETPALEGREQRGSRPRASGTRLESAHLLLISGLLTWAVIGLPYIAWAIERPDRRNLAGLVLLLAHLSFGALFVASHRTYQRADLPNSVRMHRWLLVGQSVAAIVAIIAMPDSLLMILLVIIAAQVPLIHSLRISLFWVAVQTAIAAPIARGDIELVRGLIITGTEIGFQLFAVYASTTAARERDARNALARVNAELVSTRELLASSSRLAERQRISRDLHDLMGHHLTALSLQLETAAHQADGEVGEQIRDARTITTDLLQDVRQVVRAFRNESTIELAGPLRTLVSAIQRPFVHLDMPRTLGIDDPVRANAILRSVQEIVTNTARHAEASHLRIAIERTSGRLTVNAFDDGKGADSFRAGAGLSGMRERLEELGGSLDIDPGPGSGFRLGIVLPLTEATS